MPLQVTTGAKTGLPMFAQPIHATPANVFLQGRVAHAGFALPRALAGIVAVGAVVTLLAVARRDNAQTSTKTQATVTTRKTEAVSTDANADIAAPAVRRPLSFYTGVVRGTMFNPPAPPAPPKPKAVKAKSVVVKAPPKIVVPVVPVMPINPFADWTYSGTVKMGDRTLALLENGKTSEGQYVEAGENFMGADVTAVTDQQVTLMSGGKPTMLAKSDNITVKQLNAPAPIAAPAPAQAQPQMPGMPPMGVINVQQQQPNLPPVTLPNGVVIPGNRAARRNRFLNRNFNN